jgi:uncharacterized SAM-binding protein YcdF (DUF218 family)
VTYSLIKALALPPASLVLLILVGLFIRNWARRTGTVIAVTGALALYALSTPFVATRLLVAIEAGIASPDLTSETTRRPEAIVILSAGFTHEAPIAGSVTVDAVNLQRLRHGVRLHRETGLPILVSGGQTRHAPAKLGFLMQRTLRRDFGVEAKWLEGRSRTTYENAFFSAEILKPLGIGSVYVVSQAWHLPRAVAAFEAVGLDAVPAPAEFSRPSRLELGAFLPSAGALQVGYYAVHELLGLVWYRWAYFDA